jgi:serine/threonine protein kinase
LNEWRNAVITYKYFYRSVREGIGSPFWMAPEIVRAEKGRDCWQKADIWGIGCVMIEMATAEPPWVSILILFTT